jgi:hypothetical protein
LNNKNAKSRNRRILRKHVSNRFWKSKIDNLKMKKILSDRKFKRKKNAF